MTMMAMLKAMTTAQGYIASWPIRRPLQAPSLAEKAANQSRRANVLFFGLFRLSGLLKYMRVSLCPFRLRVIVTVLSCVCVCVKVGVFV